MLTGRPDDSLPPELMVIDPEELVNETALPRWTMLSHCWSTIFT
jgi:hypothetical protein